MQPWIIEKVKKRREEKRRKARVQPQLPIPEPVRQIAPPNTTDGEERGIVSVDFEL